MTHPVITRQWDINHDSLFDLNARRVVDVSEHRHREAPFTVGRRRHWDEGHRVRQGVQDGVVWTFFQHGCKDHLLVALSTARNNTTHDHTGLLISIIMNSTDLQIETIW